MSFKLVICYHVSAIKIPGNTAHGDGEACIPGIIAGPA